jgi:multicomponent Na+:H+ antiporter subunit G
MQMLSLALLVTGCLFFLAGTVGLLRFPDTLSRLHALTKADNVGLGMVCLALALYDGTLSGGVRLGIVWLLALVAGTISAFLLARWALAAEQERDDG